MNIKMIRDFIGELPDDMEVVFSFNGCTQSGELLTPNSLEIVSAADILGIDDYLDDLPEKECERLRKINIVHFYSDRSRYDP